MGKSLKNLSPFRHSHGRKSEGDEPPPPAEKASAGNKGPSASQSERMKRAAAVAGAKVKMETAEQAAAVQMI